MPSGLGSGGHFFGTRIYAREDGWEIAAREEHNGPLFWECESMKGGESHGYLLFEEEKREEAEKYSYHE